MRHASHSVPFFGSAFLGLGKKSFPSSFAFRPAADSSQDSVSQLGLYPFLFSFIHTHVSVVWYSLSQAPHPGHFGLGAPSLVDFLSSFEDLDLFGEGDRAGDLSSFF